ncbi:hypothetical protein EUX98_g582 [Antrodiella citrinella]|uniref:Uncharacterized protein n=1 Tax=Antrodiella citrinella TaxID=2447956 RepID=A0A4S4N3T1_9APHY|nr:hypothetical protein EUX98_g582 [Antrodiella citrinella]
MPASTRWYTPILVRNASLESEVIYDSEPERVEIHKKEKVPKAKKKTPTPHYPSVVIEISSESDTDSLGSGSPHNNCAKVSTQFSSLSSHPSLPVEEGGIPNNAPPDNCGTPALAATLTTPAIIREIPVSVGPCGSGKASGPTSSTENAITSGDDFARGFDLSEFAFGGKRAGSHLSISRTPSESVIPQKPPSKPKAPRSARGPPQFSDIADRDIARVLKCVCCGVSWTSRKSSAEKIKHFQSCGKKHKLTLETVKVLLLKEVKKLPPAEGKSKRKPSPEKEEAARTLLADAVVNDATGKKRGRRPEVVETVKSIADTRSDIVARARLLLHDGASTSNVHPDSEVAAKETAEKDLSVQPLPATQPFGDSALARMFPPRPTSRPTSPALAYHPTPAAAPSPPRTQPFGESALARAFQPRLPLSSTPLDNAVGVPSGSRLSFHDDIMELSSDTESEGDRLAVQPSSSVAHNSIFALCDSSNERPLTPPLDLDPLGSPPDVLGPFSDPYWEPDDGAILHFSGAETQSLNRSDLLLCTNTSLISIFTPIHTLQRDKSSTSQSHLTPSPRIPFRPRPGSSPPPTQPIATTSKKPRKRKGDQALPSTQARVSLMDDELHLKLKECVLADTDLYLRVLRYEPVHIDHFVKLATDLGLPERGLKLRVKAFLDKQVFRILMLTIFPTSEYTLEAIHFYGHDITGLLKTNEV